MSGSRTNNSVRNILYRLISQLASIALKFVSRTVFIHILGVEYLGINGLFSEILQMLSLADLGFNTAMVFSMYKPLAEHDEYKLAQLVQLYKKIYRVIAIVISCIGLALIPFLRYLVNLDKEIPLINVYYVLYLLNTVSSYLVVYKTCILTADQKNYLVSKFDTIFNFISTAACCFFLYITHNFIVYLVVQVFFTYVRNFYCSYVASKTYPYISKKVTKLSKEESKGIFNRVKSVFIYKVATALVGSTDNTLISVMIGTVTVGLYSNYSMVIANVMLFINILFLSTTASIGNLIVEANKQKNFAVYKTMQFVSFVLSAVSISCIYNLINDFIGVWIGNSFVLETNVVIAIVMNMYFSVVLMPIWSYREATGMYLQTKYVMVATAVINLLLSVILGRLIGLAGILFATSISRLSTYFWYEPKLLFKQYFDEKVSKYYLSIANNIAVSVIVLLMVSLAFNGFHPSGWGTFALKVLAVAAASFALTILLYIRNEELKKVLKMLAGFLKRK